MNFKVRLFALVVFISIISPSLSHAWCGNPRIPENVPDCENIEHTRWPNPNNSWDTDTVTYVNYGDTVDAGKTATIITRLYTDIKFQLTHDSEIRGWAWVDNLELLYHIKTEDGTAKAGKDYQAIDTHVSYRAYPRSHSRDNSFNHLIIRDGGARNNQNRGVYPATNRVFSAGNIAVDPAVAFGPKEAKYFYVTMYNPMLFMNRKYCSSRVGSTCLYWKTNSWSGYLYEDNSWNGVIARNSSINAPKTIKQVVFIVQR